MDDDRAGSVDEDVEAPAVEPEGRNLAALRATLAKLGVDDELDATAALLVTLAIRLDSGEFSAHDAQQYRLAVDAISRATISVPSSKVDELRARRERRMQGGAGGSEG